MEIQQVNQTEFAEMLKSASNETHQTAFENDVWYEQVTIGEVTYRHKLLALRKLSSELLNKKAFESKPRIEPLRLRAQGNGPVVALVFTTKSTVFYRIMVGPNHASGGFSPRVFSQRLPNSCRKPKRLPAQHELSRLSHYWSDGASPITSKSSPPELVRYIQNFTTKHLATGNSQPLTPLLYFYLFINCFLYLCPQLLIEPL